MLPPIGNDAGDVTYFDAYLHAIDLSDLVNEFVQVHKNPAWGGENREILLSKMLTTFEASHDQLKLNEISNIIRVAGKLLFAEGHCISNTTGRNRIVQMPKMYSKLIQSLPQLLDVPGGTRLVREELRKFIGHEFSKGVVFSNRLVFRGPGPGVYMVSLDLDLDVLPLEDVPLLQHLFAELKKTFPNQVAELQCTLAVKGILTEERLEAISGFMSECSTLLLCDEGALQFEQLPVMPKVEQIVVVRPACIDDAYLEMLVNTCPNLTFLTLFDVSQIQGWGLEAILNASESKLKDLTLLGEPQAGLSERLGSKGPGGLPLCIGSNRIKRD